MSDLPSSHNSIPSPQCALGTTPHLSIRKKAKEGRGTKGRKREKEERGRKENVQEKTAEDVKNDGGKKERNREITEHFYDTERENMSHHSP